MFTFVDNIFTVTMLLLIIKFWLFSIKLLARGMNSSFLWFMYYLCLFYNCIIGYTTIQLTPGEEEAKKTQNLGLSDIQRCARARIGFFALSLIDLSHGTVLSSQALGSADKTTYNISQSCSVNNNHGCVKCIL